MSWDNLARVLHDELCEAMYCEEYIGDDSTGYTEHNLQREWWTAMADHIREYVPSRVHDDPRDRLARDLAAYIHGDECTCPYSVEPADLERAEAVLRTLDSPPPVPNAERVCARYWGSDGTLCSTHHGRFSDGGVRCDRRPVPA